MKRVDYLNPDIRIDYREHPAFAGLASYINENDEDKVYSLLKEIDNIFDFVTKNPVGLPAKSITQLHERMLVPLFDELTRTVNSITPESCLYKPLLASVIKKSADAIGEELHFFNGSKISEKIIVDAPITRQTCEDLKTKGVSTRVIPKEYTQALFNLMAAEREESMALRRTTHAQDVCSNPQNLSGQYWDITSQILKGVGFLDGLALYFGYEMVPIYCTLVHSYPGESWYRDCYEDVGMKTSKCAYMHYDHADNAPKALIYLSDVAAENGPFSVIPGSSGWSQSHVQGLLFKFLDQAAYTLGSAEKAPNDVYHRPTFKSKKFRAEFAKLPRAFQGTSHFGDDTVDGSPLSDFLLSRELKLTSDVSNCTLFSGFNTIHRGGQVERGERWAFQLMFKKKQ